ncbi:hypothetical protein [Arcticibacter eurypsychrophilus]
MHITIADAGGNLIVHVRMDGAWSAVLWNSCLQ